MDGYTAIIEVTTDTELTDEQLDIAEEVIPAGASTRYNSAGRSLRITVSVDAANMDDVIRQALDIPAKAARAAGFAYRADDVRAVTWQRYDDITKRPSTPRAGLAGTAEAAQVLGVSRQRIAELRKLPGFPAPVQQLAAGPVWDAAELEMFGRTWDRKAGRPRNNPVAPEEVD